MRSFFKKILPFLGWPLILTGWGLLFTAMLTSLSDSNAFLLLCLALIVAGVVLEAFRMRN